MTPEKREAAIKWLTDEIRSLRMAPAINGCGPENWAKQLEVMETCLEAVRGYFQFQIDREAWKECTYCSGIPHMEGVELKPCASGNIGCEVAFGKCRDDESVGMVVYHRNTAGGYVDFDFCPFCGKPQTEEAWAILEKRLRG